MADFPPDEQHGGGVLIRRLARELPSGRLCWFSSRPLLGGRMPEGLEHVPFAHADYTVRRPNRFGLASWREYLNLRWLSLLQAQKAAAWGASCGVNAVWAVMQEQVIVSGPVAARLLGVPCHVSVHDVPSYFLQGRLSPVKMKRFESIFHTEYRNAASRDVICEAMRRHCMERTGADAIVVTHGWENPTEILSEPIPSPAGDRLRIHYAGMVYDQELLRAFILGLEKERDGGRFPRFEFVLFGSNKFKPRMAPWPQSVCWLGWLNDADLAAKLKESDFLYFQHPFDQERQDFAATSFPAKLSSYLRARRPIIFHAPEYSSVSELARKHRLPFLLNQRDAASAARAFAEEWKTVVVVPGWQIGYDSAVREFDWAKTRKLFFETIGQLGNVKPRSL